MVTFYDLVHLPSGNVVGDYGSQDDAVVALRHLMKVEPTSDVTDFALLRGDGDEQSLVAKRDELRALVGATLETTLPPR